MSVTCYALTRNHTGQGSDPVASPNKSAGCGTGQYISGENITLTAAPAAGWGVAGWGGTNNDGSTATTNTVIMPAANHTVSVAYVQTAPTCYTLTLTHTGQGNLGVSPNKSAGCSTGQYISGENITLTATPAAGWRVAGWSGTNNDGSTATTNTVIMPAANHTASVIYEPAPPTCRTLTRTHSGQGSNPVATPAFSNGCGTGQYVAGENITLTATPTAGWYVAGWSGTNNDASTATTNTVTMPAANHTAHVNYVQQAGDGSRATLPFIIYGQPGFLGPMESEPNNSISQANGPILLNRVYQGFPNDLSDYYYFDLVTTRQLNIILTNITGTDPQLHLYRESVSDRVGYDPDVPYSIAYNAPPGRYYVRVVVVGGNNTNTAYTLRVEAD
jgi:NOL1/NOP2/fmu family ribosome biogenesis protein